MERFQIVTRVMCPEHGGRSNGSGDPRIYVMVEVAEDGSLTVWKGCKLCPGTVVLDAKRTDEVQQ